MIRFLREKASYIGWGIIIFFAGTMFTGTFLYNRYSKSNAPQQGRKKAVDFAQLGNLPISQRRYAVMLNQTMASYKAQKPNEKLLPETLELMHYNAFQQALRYTVLLEGAKSQKIKVSGDELNLFLERAYRELDVKGKKELKELLKRNNYPYKDFIEEQKSDILVQKFIELLKAQVTVSDKDVDNKYQEIQAQHLLFRGSDDAAQRQADQAFKDIQAGKEFKGEDLGWFGVGATLKEFEDVAFALEKGEVSKPVKTIYGYHLIKILDKRQKPRPKDFDYAKEKQQVLAEKQNRAVDGFLQSAIGQGKLEVNDPIIKAIQSKLEAKPEDAIGAYQAQISANPASPIPHYLLAKLYLMMQNPALAKEELNRAVIKAQMNPQLDLPVFHQTVEQLQKNQPR